MFLLIGALVILTFWYLKGARKAANTITKLKMNPQPTRNEALDQFRSRNHQITTRTNQSMSNYLDQLREQVTLKHMGVKDQKKQQPSALFGLPSIYDYITPNTKDSKEWKSNCLTPAKTSSGVQEVGIELFLWQVCFGIATQIVHVSSGTSEASAPEIGHRCSQLICTSESGETMTAERYGFACLESEPPAAL